MASTYPTAEIGKQRSAADRPRCHKPVLIKGFRVPLPPPGMPVAHGDLRMAADWAKRNGPPSLEAFLPNADPEESDRTRPFRRGDRPHLNLPDPPLRGTNP